MSKKLSERIQSRLNKQTDVNSKVTNKAALLALKTDINEALTAGWSLRQIWLTLKDENKIKVSYQAFCKQIKVLQLQDTPQSNNDTNELKQAQKTKTDFTFNANPDKKELL